jgi:hypothetical protein
VGVAVIFDHGGVVDGDVVSALFEVSHGITARLHHFINQSVGGSDGALGIVDELGLKITPGLSVAVPIGWRKCAKRKFLSSLFTKFEDALGAADVAFAFQDSIVFRAKPLTQFLTSSFSRHQDGNRDDGQDDNDQHGNQDCILIQAHLLDHSDGVGMPHQ